MTGSPRWTPRWHAGESVIVEPEAVQRERERLARRVHDLATTRLTRLGFQLAAMSDRVDEATRDGLIAAIEEVDRLIADMRRLVVETVEAVETVETGETVETSVHPGEPGPRMRRRRADRPGQHRGELLSRARSGSQKRDRLRGHAHEPVAARAIP